MLEQAGEPESAKDKEVTCSKCDEHVPVQETLSAGRSGHICKLCYNAQRALVLHYKKRGKKAEWDKLPVERKKKLIRENKLCGGVKGRERQIKTVEEAGMGT